MDTLSEVTDFDNFLPISLSILLAVYTLPLLSLLLALKLAPRWKSQTAHSDMHHTSSFTSSALS